MKTLEHGGNLKKFSRQFGKKEGEILDFSSNVTPLGFPESVRRLYPALLDSLTQYPDPSSTALRSEITRHFPLFPENVIVGNGSMELLALVVRSLAPKRALLVEPCFAEYRRLLHLQGAQVKSISLREGNQFSFSFKEIFGALPGTDFIILGHPNNPTGTALPREEMRELLADCRRRNIFVVIDEAFVDWCPDLSVARDVKDNASFIVLRSLTKFYGLAGIRAGYGLGSRRVIETLEARQDPWSVNIVSQGLSAAALRDGDFREQSLAWFQEESAWFYKELSALEGFRVFPGLANFFLMKIAAPLQEADSLYQFCGEKGIYLRLLNDFPGLGASYFRIALKDRAQNEYLLAAFREWAAALDKTQTPVHHV